MVFVVAVLLIGGGIWFFAAGNLSVAPMAPEKEINTPVTENVPPPQIPPKDSVVAPSGPRTLSLTMQEVGKHNSADSCYTVIRGDVYDVTSFISQHPGGPEKILGLCGKDGTAAFERKHDGQPRPEETLAGFKIGTLMQ